jgi:ABC-type phosphate/phosphonate transport system substrate-binding protein
MFPTHPQFRRLPAARAFIGVITSAALLGLLPGSAFVNHGQSSTAGIYLMGMQPLATSMGAVPDVLTDRLVLALPPDASAPAQNYEPLIRYLSRVTGKKVIYKRVADWQDYQRGMQAGDYDLAFDGAHFASWRIAHSKHQPLVKVSVPSRFVVVTRSHDDAIEKLQDLAGRRVCGPSPPDEGTLSLYEYFENPARRPLLVRTRDPQRAYAMMIAGACDAAVLPTHVYEQTDPAAGYTRVLFTTRTLPGATFTAGPRLTPQEKRILATALLSSEGRALTEPLCRRFGNARTIATAPAVAAEYVGIDTMLRGVWGFGS